MLLRFVVFANVISLGLVAGLIAFYLSRDVDGVSVLISGALVGDVPSLVETERRQFTSYAAFSFSSSSASRALSAAISFGISR